MDTQRQRNVLAHSLIVHSFSHLVHVLAVDSDGIGGKGIDGGSGRSNVTVHCTRTSLSVNVLSSLANAELLVI